MHGEVHAELLLERAIEGAVLERQREREVRGEVAREDLVALADVARLAKAPVVNASSRMSRASPPRSPSASMLVNATR